MTEALFLPLGDGHYLATEHTSGPWDPRLQHGGPPAALLADAIDDLPGLTGPVTRVAVDILGPVPVGEIEVRAEVTRPGRSVELLTAELVAGGRLAVRASAWRLVKRELDLPADAGRPPVPAPVMPDAELPESPGPGGLLAAMAWRVSEGSWGEPGPMTVWGRLRLPLVAGKPTLPLSALLVLADCGNGASGELPLDQWLYINPDLNVHLLRPPAGDWFCLQAETGLSRHGLGLATSRLYDIGGLVGHGAQSLYLAPR